MPSRRFQRITASALRASLFFHIVGSVGMPDSQRRRLRRVFVGSPPLQANALQTRDLDTLLREDHEALGHVDSEWPSPGPLDGVDEVWPPPSPPPPDLWNEVDEENAPPKETQPLRFLVANANPPRYAAKYSVR
ncbi:hypothetical protein C8F04DRAFT_1274305 [Mycena alexandri]|uniref:Uncharacterized protein n=1 Tax=Mycena alexandri TaxID=1745969 RepID=A0AAD6S5S6_9AGAR|nr:hypothetical protein C8F04DRAFT_1274305 [Mycena alexandri]